MLEFKPRMQQNPRPVFRFEQNGGDDDIPGASSSEQIEIQTMQQCGKF
jgi:hypothetical protein